MWHGASAPARAFDDLLRDTAVRFRRDRPGVPVPLDLARFVDDGYLKDAPCDPLAARAVSGETPADRVARFRDLLAECAAVREPCPVTFAEFARGPLAARARRERDVLLGRGPLEDWRRDNALRYRRAQVQRRRRPATPAPLAEVPEQRRARHCIAGFCPAARTTGVAAAVAGVMRR